MRGIENVVEALSEKEEGRIRILSFTRYVLSAYLPGTKGWLQTENKHDQQHPWYHVTEVLVEWMEKLNDK